jgi:aldehyde dehydrogenase family 7 member A1
MPDADLSLAVPAVFFGSVGTAGQRCTSTRRLYLHRAIAPEFLARLQALYASPALQPGDPLDAQTLLGPLHSRAALNIYDDTINELKDAGAEMILGNSGSGRYETLTSPLDRGNFVRPTIAMIPKQLKSNSKFKSRSKEVKSESDADADADVGKKALWAKERFVPVLCVAEFEELDEAIAWNNAVPQGLSSSLWTRDIRHVGKWIGPAGSDTGIVNVSVFFFFFFFLICSRRNFIFFSLGQCWYERCRDWCSIWWEQGQF